MNKENIKVVILGRNYSTALSIVRALGKAGYEISLFYVVITNKAYAIAASSKYVSQYHVIYENNDRKILNALFEQYCSPNTIYILIPTDDNTSSLIDRHRGELGKQFLMPYVKGNEEGIISRYMDKKFQIELAREFCLNVAKSWIIGLDTDGFNIPADVEYPCFCKPLISIKGRKAEIGTCRTKEELLQFLNTLREHERNRSVLIQELINIDEEFSVPGICFDEEVLLPALLKKLRTAEFCKGVTLMGRVDGFEVVGGEVMYKLKEMLASLHYVGMIDIELIRSGDKIYFNEINFRCSGVNYAITVAGCNMPELFIDALLRNGKSSGPIQIKYGLKFVNDKAAWEDYINERISRKELDHCLRESDFTLLGDPNDSKPMNEFRKEMRRMFLIKRIGKLLPVKLKEIVKTILIR